MGGRRQCCCHKDCIVFEDAFERESLGTNWNVISGGWTIDGNNLREAGDPSAIVLAATPTTNGGQMGVWALLKNFKTNPGHRIIANANEDGTQCYYADFEYMGGKQVRITLGGSLGVIRQMEFTHSSDLSDQAGAGICIDHSSVSALLQWAGESFVYDCNPTLVTGGYYGGLGNFSGNVIHFDDFELTNFRGNLPVAVEPDPCVPDRCCRQQCMCCAKEYVQICLPMELTLTLTGWGGCAGVDGITFPLYYGHHDGHPGWLSTPDADRPPCLTNARWFLRCSAKGSSCYPLTGDPGFTLEVRCRAEGDCYNDACVDEDPNCPFMAFTSSRLQENIVCNPFEVQFDTYAYSHWIDTDGDGIEEYFGPESCPCCEPHENGGWYATVTE